MLRGDSGKLSFSVSERLKNVKQIDYLFKNSETIKAFPLIFNYIFLEEVQQASIQLLFSAPKRNFRKSVDRNRIKRVLRERLRLMKPELLKAMNGKSLQGALIYTSRDKINYRAIDSSLKKIIHHLDVKTRS